LFRSHTGKGEKVVGRGAVAPNVSQKGDTDTYTVSEGQVKCGFQDDVSAVTVYDIVGHSLDGFMKR